MPRITYTARLPSPPPALDRIESLLIDQLLDQGAPALRHLQQPANAPQLDRLLAAGLIQKSPDGTLHPGPTALQRAEQIALASLLRARDAGPIGRQQTERALQGSFEPEDSRPYAFGDPPDRLDIPATLRRALTRTPSRPPISLQADDLIIQEGTPLVRRGIVLLLDQSGSMAQYGKFACARRLALGLRALLRTCCPEDRLEIVGFATRAAVLSGRALLEATPRSIGLFDSRAALRVPRDAPNVPEHFTNIQGALRLARRLLLQSGAGDRQVICVTDGEPTAHEEDGHLVLAYPCRPETARCTLAEARRGARAGFRLSVFGLVDEDAAGLRSFVARLALAGSGRAVCCSAGHLGRLVLDRLLGGRAREE